ncbi:hypothetical protein Tco_0360708 [Tanacetum coccineum]
MPGGSRSRKRLPRLGPITKTNPIGGYNLRPRDSLIPFKNNNPSPHNVVVSPPSLTSDDLHSVLLALKEPCKVIDGRITVCGLAKDTTSVFFADYMNAGRNVDGAKALKLGDIAALVTADTQGDVAKPKVLIRGTFGSSGVTISGGNSSGLVGPGGIQGYGGRGQGMSYLLKFKDTFGNGGPSVSSFNGGNSGGLGLQGGLAGGSFGYGVLGQGPPLGDSQHPLNLSSGGGSVISSFGSSVDVTGLSTSGGLPPSSLRVDGGGVSGDSYLGGRGASYGGKGSGIEAGLGIVFGPFGGRGSSYGVIDSGGGSQSPNSLGAGSGAGYSGSHFGGPGLSYGGTGSGGGVELGTGVGGAGPSYGRIGSGVAGFGTRFAKPGGRHGGISSDGGVGLGSGFGGLGPLGQMSHCGLSPASMKTSSESAHYSLSSGSADQTQQQKKKYKVAHYNL